MEIIAQIKCTSNGTPLQATSCHGTIVVAEGTLRMVGLWAKDSMFENVRKLANMPVCPACAYGLLMNYQVATVKNAHVCGCGQHFTIALECESCFSVKKAKKAAEAARVAFENYMGHRPYGQAQQHVHNAQIAFLEERFEDEAAHWRNAITTIQGIDQARQDRKARQLAAQRRSKQTRKADVTPVAPATPTVTEAQAIAACDNYKAAEKMAKTVPDKVVELDLEAEAAYLFEDFEKAKSLWEEALGALRKHQIVAGIAEVAADVIAGGKMPGMLVTA